MEFPRVREPDRRRNESGFGAAGRKASVLDAPHGVRATTRFSSCVSYAENVLTYAPVCLDVAFFLGSLNPLCGLSHSLCKTSETVRRHFRTPFIYSAVGGLKSGFLGVRMNMSTLECEMIPPMRPRGSKLSGNIKLVEVDSRLYAFTESIDNNKRCYALEQYDPSFGAWKDCSLEGYGEIDDFIKMNSYLYVFGKSQRDHGEWPLVFGRYNCRNDTIEKDMPSLPTPRCGTGIVAMAGRYIYVLGGHHFGDEATAVDFSPLAVAERYDSCLNVWEKLQPMQLPRRMCKAVALKGHVYAIGGLGLHDIVATPERYEPESRCWTALPAMPTPRSAVQAVEHNGRVYVFGGTDDSGLQTLAVERFDPRANSWSTLPAVGYDGDVACKNLGVSILSCRGRIYTLYTELSFSWPEPQVVLRRYHEDHGPDDECYRLFSCSSHICAAAVSELE